MHQLPVPATYSRYVKCFYNLILSMMAQVLIKIVKPAVVPYPSYESTSYITTYICLQMRLSCGSKKNI